jgi:hypothetical protein
MEAQVAAPQMWRSFWAELLSDLCKDAKSRETQRTAPTR